MTTMPTEITYGHVTGRFIAAWTDGPDAGRLPDPRPLEGLTVKITPKTQFRRLAGASPVLVATMPVTCGVDADGVLIDAEKAEGVWLVTGVYEVKYTHGSVSIPAHDIEVTDAHTEDTPLDLVTAQPPGGPVLTASQYAELSARIDALPTGGGGGGAVSSVNGKTGAVTLSAADVSALPSTYTPPAPSWGDVTGKPSTFTPSAHTHAVADVTGLQAALDGKQPAGSYAPTSHVHTIANVTGLQAALDGKQPAGSYAAASHAHAISDVTGLQSALDTAGTPQTLSLTGSDLSLSGGGGTVTLPSGGGGETGLRLRAGEWARTISTYDTQSYQLTLNSPVAVPIRLAAGNYDRISINVHTASAGGVIRLGIIDGATEQLIADLGTVSTSVANTVAAAGSFTVTIGGWYLAVVTLQGSPAGNVGIMRGGTIYGMSAFSDDLQYSPGGSIGYDSSVAGAYPANWSALPRSSRNFPPIVGVRKSA